MSADAALRAMVKHLAEYHRQTPEDISLELEVEIGYVLRVLGRTNDPRVKVEQPLTLEERRERKIEFSQSATKIREDLRPKVPPREIPTRTPRPTPEKVRTRR